MKKWMFTTGLFISLGFTVIGQEEKEVDTSNLVIGNKVIRIYKEKGDIVKVTFDAKDSLAYHEIDSKERRKDSLKIVKYKKEGHWQGMDFGTSVLLNSNGQNTFVNQSFLENKPENSFYFNLNLIERKLPVISHYFGLTTGLGFNWTSIGIKNNQFLHTNADSVWTIVDPNYKYDINKVRATYLTIPLFLEFSSNNNPNKSMYFMAGVVGGIKIGSKFIQILDDRNTYIEHRIKGDYALNSFKLDASVRTGYKNIGVFANYNMLAVFDTKRVEAAYPLSFGLSLVW